MTIHDGRSLPRQAAPLNEPSVDASYRQLFDTIDEGFCVIEMIFDGDGRAVDYRFVEANPLFEEQVGLVDTIGRTARELVPNLEDTWIETYARIARTGTPERFEDGSEAMGRWFDVFAAPFGPYEQQRVAILFRDVTQRHEAELALRRSEQRLADSEQRARIAVAVARLGTWTYDPSTEIATLDRRMCAIWGRDAAQADISLREIVETVHADDRSRLLDAVSGALDPKGDGVYEVEYRIVLPDESVRWLAAYGQALFEGSDAGRHPVSIVGTVADVTDRRDAEHALRVTNAELQLELDSAKHLQSLSSRLIEDDDPDALYEHILDAAMALMHSEMASMQLFVPDRNELRLLAWRGFHPESAAFWQWVSLDSASSCGNALRDMQRVFLSDIERPDSGITGDDLEHYRLCGIRSVQSTPLISRTGKLLGMISTHWRAPHAIDERELTLLDVVARQAADMIERRDAEAEVLRALAAKDEFLGLVSHELRTPITTILGNADVLLRLGDAIDVNARQDALGDVRQNAERLRATVDDLLALARAERGVLEPEPLALGRAVRRIVDEVRSNSEVPIHVRGADEPCIVNGDFGVLQQVLRNFISNAQKYGAGSDIQVEITRHGSEASVCVLDRGLGIKPDEAERVFDSFYRAPEAARISGLGIGLSVCRRLAEAIGGRVWAEPREGGGSRFGFVLPLNDESSREGAT